MLGWKFIPTTRRHLLDTANDLLMLVEERVTKFVGDGKAGCL